MTCQPAARSYRAGGRLGGRLVGVAALPGLMDMELNLLIGGPETPTGLPLPMHGVQDDPVYRALRGAVNARTTLLAVSRRSGTCA